MITHELFPARRSVVQQMIARHNAPYLSANPGVATNEIPEPRASPRTFYPTLISNQLLDYRQGWQILALRARVVGSERI